MIQHRHHVHFVDETAPPILFDKAEIESTRGTYTITIHKKLDTESQSFLDKAQKGENFKIVFGMFSIKVYEPHMDHYRMVLEDTPYPSESVTISSRQINISVPQPGMLGSAADDDADEENK